MLAAELTSCYNIQSGFSADPKKTTKALEQIQNGYSKEQVKIIMGNPQQFKSYDSTECLFYNLHEVYGNNEVFPIAKTYMLTFKGDKLDKYNKVYNTQYRCNKESN